MSENIEQIFAQAFSEDYNTRLVGGAEEPLYEPGEPNCTHKIHYRHDYFASALHEVAHWCVAGSQRRLQTDYGYWYAEDGRSEEQQRLFEQVEIKPQALEWIFSKASARPFRVSADNLAQNLGPSPSFKQAIYQACQNYCAQGLPPRPARFVAELAKHYRVEAPLSAEHFTLEALDT